MKLGVIGVGAMGGAIALRLLETRTTIDSNFRLVVCDPDPNKRNRFIDYDYAKTTDKMEDLLDCDMVIVAVKPSVVEEVLSHRVITDIPIIVSIAAGVSKAKLTKICQKPVIRAMPNTPCSIGQGVCAVSFPTDLPIEAKTKVTKLFTQLGEVIEVEENLFPAVTALSGCGPAYVFLMIEALIDAGCSQGLTRDVAKKLVVSTFIGSSNLVHKSQLHPAVLKDQVTSPKGVTIKALHVLEQKGLRGILWDAVNQAVAGDIR